ncbi:MAG: hypothetical protein QXT82_06330 [Candidatus Caldarchaeum sp.]
MRDPQAALRIIIRTGDRLAELLREKGLRESDIGRGDMRLLLNKNRSRGKDLFTMSLKKFVVGDTIVTPDWEMVIKSTKPIVHLKLKKL